MHQQQTFDDLNINPDMIKAVDTLLNGDSYMVSKPVRAGVTTSLIIAAEKKHKTMLYLAPTNKIIMETVVNAAKMANIENLSIRVPANKECSQLQKEISNNKILQQLPLSLPNCSKCNNLIECRVKDILYHPEAHLKLSPT